MRLSGFLAALIVIAFLGSPLSAFAAAIIYTGDENQLQDAPQWFPETSSYAIFPGTTDTPISSGNSVTIDYDQMVHEMAVPDFVFGGLDKAGNSVGNKVAILSGPVSGYILGGVSVSGDAVSNVVTILGGSVRDSVLGGWSYSGHARDNAVAIYGRFYVGQQVYGGFSKDGGDATGNTVTIGVGSAVRDAYGGYSPEGEAAGNTVIVNGGSVDRIVCGGWSGGVGAANNTVTISGGAELAKAVILGGVAQGACESVAAGNTLNLKGAGISVESIKCFEYYNFYLPKSLAAGAVMLSTADVVYLGGTTVTIFVEDSANIQTGDKIALIHTALGFNGSPENKGCKVKHDGAIYEFSIYTNKNNLWAEVTKISNAAK